MTGLHWQAIVSTLFQQRLLNHAKVSLAVIPLVCSCNVQLLYTQWWTCLFCKVLQSSDPLLTLHCVHACTYTYREQLFGNYSLWLQHVALTGCIKHAALGGTLLQPLLLTCFD